MKWTNHQEPLEQLLLGIEILLKQCGITSRYSQVFHCLHSLRITEAEK